jgi:hypothetical protein
MTKLSDLQLILLSTASQRDDGSLLPPPDSIGDRTPAVDRAIKSLIRRGLAAELDTSDVSGPLPIDRYPLVGVRITAAGRAALGVKENDDEAGSRVPSEAPPPAPPAQQTKTALVLSMLRSPTGATLDQLVAATGWLPHTARAALTGLRKKGHALSSERVEGAQRVYRVATA